MKFYKQLIKHVVLLICPFLLIWQCQYFKQPGNQNTLLINQHSYQLGAVKKALAKDYSGNFIIISSTTGDTVFSGNTSELSYWKHSGEQYATLDFSSVNVPGEYSIQLDMPAMSRTFSIKSASDYHAITHSALKTYYLHRLGEQILPEFAGKWARAAGHPDTAVIVHESATNSLIKPGSVIASPGGWYDAGDYNKYIVNSAITVYTLLETYNHFSGYFDTLNLNIPESKNEIPDILDEIIVNIRWMLTMQDSDGGVHHKLTALGFEGFVMPEDAVKQRYITMKTTPASLDFAASMAVCARTLKKFDALESLSDSCLDASIAAWEWARNHTDVFYVQPEDISTGEYNDTNLIDEQLWAGVELYISTRDEKYLDEELILNFPYPFTTPSWDVVNTLALMSIVSNQDIFDPNIGTKATALYLDLATGLFDKYERSPALTSIDYFKWGSNSDVANQAMIGFMTYKLTSDNKFLELGRANVDYLMGRNATGYCFVSGFGQQYPMHIHHRPSAADGIDEPIPGFLIGGPNIIVPNDCGEEVSRSLYPALSYIDAECSYSTNEIAINWNAPFVYCAAAMVNY